MSQNTTPLLERERREAQERLAARHNGEDKKAYRSAWVVEKLRTRLPPEHVRLAEKLADIQAQIEGMAKSGCERVDGSNATETAQVARLDAARAMAGYEAAALTRWSKSAVLALRGIVEGDSFTDLAVRVGLSTKSNHSVVLLVQVTLTVLQQYDDENLRAAQPNVLLTPPASFGYTFA